MKKNSPYTDVCESGFALTDMNLFLDTHPHCKEAIQYGRNTSEKYRKDRAAHTAANHPLTMYETQDDCFHSWISGPWPWEGGMR
ncbi:MAG: spore coat protein CotJB [Lachnospiraceae bacterium]|nr:spore coat protein CotJB [Lachnospiraceae bacterium]